MHLNSGSGGREEEWEQAREWGRARECTREVLWELAVKVAFYRVLGEWQKECPMVKEETTRH
jgi:hypothetical protein